MAADGDHDSPDEDTTTYQFDVDSEVWSRFTAGVPSEATIAEHLTFLLAADAPIRPTIEDLPHLDEDAVACHLRHRAEQARDALRRGDEETAREELDRIVYLADALV